MQPKSPFFSSATTTLLTPIVFLIPKEKNSRTFGQREDLKSKQPCLEPVSSTVYILDPMNLQLTCVIVSLGVRGRWSYQETRKGVAMEADPDNTGNVEVAINSVWKRAAVTRGAGRETHGCERCGARRAEATGNVTRPAECTWEAALNRQREREREREREGGERER